MAPFKPLSALNLLFSGTVSDGAVSNSIDTSQPCVALVQHSISNSK